VQSGFEILEAGTPWLAKEGLRPIEALAGRFAGKALILADYKLFDSPAGTIKAAAAAGADIVTIMAAAPISVIEEAIMAAREFGAEIMVDMMGFGELLGESHLVRRAKLMEEMGVDAVAVHKGISDQVKGKGGYPFSELRKIAGSISIPCAAVGGLTSIQIPLAISCGAKILVFGGSLHKAADPQKEALEIIAAKERALREIAAAQALAKR
jgi:3-hexulose-6-phosphate synthase/6-phospho-3-hexuloisomerase